MFDFASRNYGKNVSIEMNDATLPFGIRIKIADRLDQAQACIANNQFNAGKPTFLQVPEEAAPAGLVFLGSLDHTKDLAETILSHANGDQNGYVAYLVSPYAF